MQTDHKQIVKMTAERTGKNEQMYRDISSFVFTEVQHLLKKPKSLILKLKGVGSWHLRKRRMEIVVDEYKEPLVDEFTSLQSLLEFKERRDRYEMFKERLKDYEEYLAIKKQVRLKRNETQVLLQPNKGEDQGPESS